MIDREVIDIINGTLSAFLVFFLLLSPTKTSLFQYSIVGFEIALVINFVHLFLKQLNRLTKSFSIIVLTVNFVVILFGLYSFTVTSPSPVEGFWDFMDNGYTNMFYFISICFLISSALGIVAKPVKNMW